MALGKDSGEGIRFYIAEAREEARFIDPEAYVLPEEYWEERRKAEEFCDANPYG